MPRLRIVIVNYRTPQMTVDCLASLVPEVSNLSDCQVVVADNASGDGSVEVIAAAIAAHGWQSWAKVQTLEKNLGFAAGNNAVLREMLAEPAPADYFLLLNPDTIVHAGAIAALLEFLEANARVGIAGSRLEARDRTPQCSAFRFPGVLSEFEATVRLGLVSRLLRRRRTRAPRRIASLIRPTGSPRLDDGPPRRLRTGGASG